MSIDRTCEVCSAPFRSAQYVLDQGYGRFCSLQCSSIAQSRPVDCVCHYCGASFRTTPNAPRKYCTQSCYRLDKKKGIDKICEHCAAPFVTTAAMLRKGPVRFCSRACWRMANVGSGHPSWKGGVMRLLCTGCGQEFDRPLTWAKRPAEMPSYCSHACKVKHHRAHPEATANWRDGATPAHEKERKSWQYRDWRDAVYARDDYTCKKCGNRGGRIQAHHLYRFSLFPALRYVVANGHTLCEPCHLAIKGKEAEYLRSLGLSPTEPSFTDRA